MCDAINMKAGGANWKKYWCNKYWLSHFSFKELGAASFFLFLKYDVEMEVGSRSLIPNFSLDSNSVKVWISLVLKNTMSVCSLSSYLLNYVEDLCISPHFLISTWHAFPGSSNICDLFISCLFCPPSFSGLCSQSKAGLSWFRLWSFRACSWV